MERTTVRVISAAIWLVLGALFMVIVQVWIDQYATDYHPFFQLWDLGFIIIPHSLPKWAPDVVVAVLFVVAAIRIIFFPLPDRKSALEVCIR